jgi:hypothetical protein
MSCPVSPLNLNVPSHHIEDRRWQCDTLPNTATACSAVNTALLKRPSSALSSSSETRSRANNSRAVALPGCTPLSVRCCCMHSAFHTGVAGVLFPL